MLRRRRRLQDDRDLAESLRQKVSDLEVLVGWAGEGEDVGGKARFAFPSEPGIAYL